MNDTEITSGIVEYFHQQLGSAVVTERIPFTILENPAFRRMLRVIDNDATNLMLPESSNFLESWTRDRYQHALERVKSRMAKSPFSKHISFDPWTLPNRVPLVSIFVHYTDCHRTVKDEMLGIWEVEGGHSDANTAATVVEAMRTFDLIGDDVLGFLSSNIDPESRCIHHIIRLLKPDLTESQIETEVAERRLYCLNRVFDACAEAIIRGGRAPIPGYDDRYTRAFPMEDDLLVQDRYKSGPLGRLFKIVDFIRQTRERRESFSEMVHRDRGTALYNDGRAWRGIVTNHDTLSPLLTIVPNDGSQWHTKHRVIHCAWKHRKTLDDYTTTAIQHPDPSQRLQEMDRIGPNDWFIIANILEALRLIGRYNKHVDSHTSNFSIVMPSLVCLMARFQDWDELLPAETPPSGYGVLHHTSRSAFEERITRTGLDDDDFINSSSHTHSITAEGRAAVKIIVGIAMDKLRDGGNHLHRSSAYWNACILNPEFRLEWIQRHCPDERDHIYDTFKAVYIRDYHNIATEDLPVLTGGQQLAITNNRELHQDRNHFQSLPSDACAWSKPRVYINDYTHATEDLIAWWKTQESTQPKLTRMAFDIHSMPPTTSDCQRCKINARLTVSSHAQHVSIESINIIESLNFWKRREYMQGEYDDTDGALGW